MDSTETEGARSILCLMCWELKGPDDVLHDPIFGRQSWYCKTCDTIQRAHTRAHLQVMFSWQRPTRQSSYLCNGCEIGPRWQDYIIECLYGRLLAAVPPRIMFSPELYRGANSPLLSDGTPLVWRIRIFHTRRRGYAEGWWNPQVRRWDWSLLMIDADAPAAEWSEWRKVIRDAPTLGRPAGSALIFFATVEAFLAHLREVVSEHGWALALPGADAITRRQVRQSVRAGRVTQAQLGEILGCDRRTIARALARFKEENQLDWPDLQQQIAKWSHEP